jgi:hypothetical protein
LTKKRYRQGVHYEYVERDMDRSLGYWSVRMYGSKGYFDVLTLTPEGLLLKEVKSERGRKRSYKDAIKKLQSLPSYPYLTKMVVVYHLKRAGGKAQRREIVC